VKEWLIKDCVCAWGEDIKVGWQFAVIVVELVNLPIKVHLLFFGSAGVDFYSGMEQTRRVDLN